MSNKRFKTRTSKGCALAMECWDMGIRVTRIVETGEYRVCPIQLGEESAYYTIDKEDALTTAKAMAKELALTASSLRNQGDSK